MIIDHTRAHARTLKRTTTDGRTDGRTVQKTPMIVCRKSNITELYYTGRSLSKGDLNTWSISPPLLHSQQKTNYYANTSNARTYDIPNIHKLLCSSSSYTFTLAHTHQDNMLHAYASKMYLHINPYTYTCTLHSYIID